MKHGNLRKITFTKDHSVHKKGDTVEIDGMIASRLVSEKVAKPYSDLKKTKEKEDQK